MPTYEQIKDQINSLNHKYIFYTKKEIKYLPQILVEGEEIRALTSGFNDGRTVLAVCTNRRVLFLDKGMFFGLRQWQMALDRIQAIDGDYTLVFGRIRFWDGAAPLEMTMVLANTIDPFIKETRQAIDDFRKLSFNELTQQSGHHGVVDIASQIERLAKLLQSGHLTPEEFQQQKDKLLNS
jgi:hypothetical protein